MKRYCIKCQADRTEYFDILSETEYGYRVRLTRTSDGNEKISEEILPRHLFDICVKTGYIYKMKADTASVA
jgi:hypothetical protein